MFPEQDTAWGETQSKGNIWLIHRLHKVAQEGKAELNKGKELAIVHSACMDALTQK